MERASKYTRTSCNYSSTARGLRSCDVTTRQMEVFTRLEVGAGDFGGGCLLKPRSMGIEVVNAVIGGCAAPDQGAEGAAMNHAQAEMAFGPEGH